jgi:hypothetical protein
VRVVLGSKRDDTCGRRCHPPRRTCDRNDAMGFLSILNRLPGASGTLAPIVLSAMTDGAGLARPGTFPDRLAA